MSEALDNVVINQREDTLPSTRFAQQLGDAYPTVALECGSLRNRETVSYAPLTLES